MGEQFIIHYIPYRVRQLGYTNYHVRYRDILVKAGVALVIPAYNELYFIVDGPVDMVVESDYGVYDTWVPLVNDNQHEHRGEVTITNRTTGLVRIKFIQVILVD